MCSRRGPYACDRIEWLGSVHLPGGGVTDTREKKSQLPIDDPKGRGPVSCSGLGVMIHLVLLRHWETTQCGCAHSNFNLVGACNARVYATRLRSVHLPRDARRAYVRRSRHLLFTTQGSRAVEFPGSRGTSGMITPGRGPERKVGLHLEESVHYLRVTVHRTVVVDSLHEQRPRVFELTRL
ncbi:hypothetical protein CRG98_014591 [Punica granatum]|uniref:Uncharacterized protein n=1 Tax=Punica granatum TaxID=22663 RepID=A0A2I0KB45_PUNGR|nr:hypothetical protein CRG98_014591 [Punica granatum]